MPAIAFFDFPFHVPMEVTPQVAGLAESITHEPGFMWKIWTEDTATNTAGGVYLFKDVESAKAYVEKHTARVVSMGVPKESIYAKVLAVQEEATAITKASFLLSPKNE